MDVNYKRLGIANEIHKIYVSDIKIREGLNQRIDYGDIESLAHSIFENGLMEPIRFFLENDPNGSILKDKTRCNLYVTEGHRRISAIKWGYDNIPGFADKITVINGINSGQTSNEEDWLKQQILLNEKKQFTPLEKARVYKRLMELGWTENRISKQFNTGFASVQDLLKLAAAPTQVQQLVEDNKITSNAVISTIDEIQNEVGRNTEAIVDVYQESIAINTASGGKGRTSPKHVKQALEVKKPKRKASEIPLREKSDRQLLDVIYSLSYTKALAGGMTQLNIPSEIWDEVVVRLNK